MKTLQEQYYDMQMATQKAGRRRFGGGNAADNPIAVQLIQLLFDHGSQSGASDIHIQPYPQGVRVRYRIDGVLHEALQLPSEVSDPLIRAIKTKAELISEPVGRSKPQDGRISYSLESGEALDLRLSCFPTIHGDSLALRIFRTSATLMSLDNLGFAPDVLRSFNQTIHRPNGLVLVTGPTNSGKTTVLYAVLDKLRSPQIKIVTLEDPVEFQLEGVDQAMINTQVGITFASGLRAIMRQDANAILVGEIRDVETAEVAIRAALTGHAVFSTLHTRHSAGAVARLIDMGIEPHMIVASLNGVLAMRLIRLICTQCKMPDPEAGRNYMAIMSRLQKITTMSQQEQKQNFHRGKGCPACNNTGFLGRTGIYEFLLLNDEFKRNIIENSTNNLYKMAVKAGMRTMLMDGLEKAARGITTIKEVLRVTG